MPTEFLELPVTLGQRSYPIRVGSGALSLAADTVSTLLPECRRLIILSDTHVMNAYGSILTTQLTEAGYDYLDLTVAPGEGSKSFGELERLANAVLHWGIDRQSALLALGGGVVGDLGGFLASILLRGIPFIQLPTTLLAQVDSSVGGKTAINSPVGKNLIGSFYQPRLVLADTDTLRSLPARELRAGYAEIVKYALIGDAAFFEWLEAHSGDILACDGPALRHAIYTGCSHKARIVAADETEQSQRALLNLGHTFGHAYEKYFGYDGRLLHGEAVALGMVQAFQLSAALGHCDPGHAVRLTALLQQAGLPTSPRDLPDTPPPKDILNAMYDDKKSLRGSLTFILARGIGEAFIARDVPANAVMAVLESA